MNNQEAFQTFYNNPDNRGMWWKPTGLTSKMKAPFLLAIPNALVELLRDQGTPTIANTNGGITEMQWRTVRYWCTLAGQGSASNKSLLAIKIDLVVIDDEEFDTWVRQKLDVA